MRGVGGFVRILSGWPPFDGRPVRIRREPGGTISRKFRKLVRDWSPHSGTAAQGPVPDSPNQPKPHCHELEEESVRDLHVDKVVQASLTPFTRKGVPSTVAAGRDAELVASLEQRGYTLCTFVSDGSAPATRGEAAILLLFFAATGYGCFRWIKRRRARSLTEHAMNAYRGGLASGIEKAIRESLESGMAKARAATPPALPATTPPVAR